MMKRYGDNVSPTDAVEEEQQYDKGQLVDVFHGGCGAMFGSIPRPVEPRKKQSSTNLFSLFELGQKRTSNKQN